VDSLFGLSMNAIMVAMLVLLGISLSTVVFVALRNRLLFIIGLRNIPRRVAQTVLIIIGLMLSTLIISAAFTTGDTVDHSITNFVYERAGSVDEVVQFQSEDGGFASADVSIPMSVAGELETALANDPEIDGITAILTEKVPLVNLGTRQSAPSVNFVGADQTRLEGFPDIENLQGEHLSLDSLAENQVYVNEKAAEDVEAKPGETLTVYFENQPLQFEVVDIVKTRALTGGFGTEDDEGMVTRLDTLQKLLHREGEVDFIGISNRGGVHSGLALSDSVTAKVEKVIKDKGLDLSVEPWKKDGVDTAEQVGNGIMTFFLVMGLFSIAAGILLIVMIFVMLAAERKTEMGISRAIGTKRRQLIQIFMSEGMGYNMMSALVGVGLGVLVSLVLTGVMAAIFGQFFSIEPHVTGRSLIISYSLGVALTFLTVVFSSWRVSNLNIVRAIRDVPEPPARPRRRSLILGILVVAFGGLMILSGLSSGLQFPYALGVSLIFFGAAVSLRYLGVPERPLFTTVGLVLLVFWLLGAGQRIPPKLEGDIEMFFLSGIVMVASAVFVIVYNAHLLLALVLRAGVRLGRILPAVKTAIAYPLASKFRTGMTMAMIALVVFALTMMSAMNANFDRLFLSESARGGWDVRVDENPNNPIGDLRQTLNEEGSVDTSQFVAVGKLGWARPAATDLRQDPNEEFEDYLVRGANDAFLARNDIPLQSRATGYESDRAVWDAIRSDPNLAVIDAFALGGGGFQIGPSAFTIEGIEPDQKVFDPVTVEVRDRATGETGNVQIIGVVQTGASATFFGVTTSDQFVETVFGGPQFSTYFIQLADPSTADETAKAIESALFTSGAQASSIKSDIEESNRLFQGFFYLMQGFMALGLVVGVAAVGVIAFRMVVERRQQIGMLRAIGYTRGTVALSFLLESSFVAITGILAGVGLAIALAYFLITSDELSTAGITSFYIPWMQITLIGLFAYGASLVMTWIPSRQAAGIPIAAALRYE
jgi:putative ABC transport system permease protein